MKKVFIGIDISKDWLDLAVNIDQVIVDQKRISNNPSEITKELNRLRKKYKGEKLWFCLEHTGHYGLLLCCVLESMGLIYSVVPALEIKKSIGMTRGKNDKVDSTRIAEYAAVFNHKLKKTELPAASLAKIKEILSYRGLLVKIKVQLKNSLHAHKMVRKLIDNSQLIMDIKKKIKQFELDIAKLEKKLIEEINSQEDLKRSFQLTTSVKGVGLIISASMLVITNNFTAFTDPRKFNSYSGIAPFESSSGYRKGKTKTSPLANKEMKKLLITGARSAAVHDPQLKQYYKRKMAEGKEKTSVINAVTCKLVSRVFATVRRQSPYVVLAN